MVINQEPTVELWQQESGIKGLMKHIERCGRVSYKSEGRITEGSYVEFIERMEKLGHGTVLEHGTVYLVVDDTSPNQISLLSKYKENKYSKCNCFTEIITGTQTSSVFITTNYRVLLQGDYKTWEEAVKNGYNKNWLDDLEYMVEPDSRFEKRISIHIITDRGVSAEANRHRVNTVTERSTRYCDYSNEKKFNGQIRVMVPPELKDRAQSFREPEWGMGLLKDYCNDIVFGTYNIKSLFNEFDTWMFANLACEFSYKRLRELGWTAQQSRRVLPLNLETEMVHTAFKSDWDHFLELRCAPNAHPDMQIIANKIKEIILHE